MKKIIAVLIIILIIFGGVFYSRRREATLEKQVRQAEENMRQLDSYTAEMEMVNELKGMEEEMSMNWRGNFDIDFREPLLRGDSEFEVEGDRFSVKIGVVLRYLNDNLYGKVDAIPPTLLGPENYDLLTENYVLIWEGLQEDLDEYLVEITKDWEDGPYFLADIEKELKEWEERMWEEEVVEVKSMEEDEINGERAKKFTLEMDGQKTADFIFGVFEDHGLSDFFSEEEMEDFQDELEGMENSELNYWIKNGYIVKMESTYVSDLRDLEEMEDWIAEEMPEEIITTYIVRYDNFNEDFSVGRPESYISLGEVLESLFNVSLEEILEEVPEPEEL